MSKYRTKKIKLLTEGNSVKKKQSRLEKYYSNYQGKNTKYNRVNYEEPRKYGDWQQSKKYKKYINKI